jgi:hypothetical protein
MDNILLERILTILDEDNHSTVFDLLLQTLLNTSPTYERHWTSIFTHISDVLDLITERSASLLESSAVAVAVAIYQNDLLNLIQFNSGFHFQRQSDVSHTAQDIFNCTNRQEDPRIGPQSMGTSWNSFGCQYIVALCSAK